MAATWAAGANGNVRPAAFSCWAGDVEIALGAGLVVMFVIYCLGAWWWWSG